MAVQELRRNEPTYRPTIPTASVLPAAGDEPVDIEPGRDSIEAWAERGPNAAGIGVETAGRSGDAREDPSFRRVGAETAGDRPRSERPRTGDAPVASRSVGIASGVRRQAGIQSVPADRARVGGLELTGALLTRAREMTGTNPQLRFQIGSETLTAGQLRYELERNPQRFGDFLRANGISVQEFNELLDDLVAGAHAPGTTFDLRPGSELARAYHIGGPGGETVDLHLDRRATTERAAGERGAGQRVDLSRERVEGPNVLEQIGEAFAEAAGWVARLFGSSWNPDTVTFNGRVDDEHFRQTGARLAESPEHGLAIQALLSTPQGTEELRRDLRAQRPASATELPWNRAVDDMIAGARSGVARAESQGRLPAGLSAADESNTLLYLRSRGFSAEARADLALVMAQPPRVRSAALQALTELPQTERNNMLALFRAPAAGTQAPDNATPEARTAFHTARTYANLSPEAREAVFETLRRDGFQRGPGTHDAADVVRAARMAENIPASMRQRYLALLPQLGVDRIHLATHYRLGIAHQLQARSPAAAERMLTDLSANMGSTRQLERILGAGGVQIRVVDPRAGVITQARDRARVVAAMEAHNIRLNFRTNEGTELTITARGPATDTQISLERYFSDSTYRARVLAQTGMRREAFEGFLTNLSGSLRQGGSSDVRDELEGEMRIIRRQLTDPASTEEDRLSARSRLRELELEYEAARAPANVDIDISPNSEMNSLFGLNGAQGERADLQLAARRVIDGAVTLEMTLRGPTSMSGRPGQEYVVRQDELAAILRNNGQAARQAFEARWPGLDYQETVMAFAQVISRIDSGTAPDSILTDDGYRVDLTRRTGDAQLDRLRAQLTDRRRGNVGPGRPLEADLGGRTTSAAPDPSRLWSDARVGAAAGNQWFQYGIFNVQGYNSAVEVERRASRSCQLAGNRGDPSHVMSAILDLDRFDRSDVARDGVNYRQNGVAHGNAGDFLVDPRTGVRAQPQDFQLLTFSGSGSASDRAAFVRSAERMRDTFVRYGGVPQGNTEIHRDISPERMYRAIEAEITRDPRAADARTDDQGRVRTRTVVVHFAGHTGSNDDDSVAGMQVTGPDGRRTWFTPDQVAQLDRLAREQGVNLVWVTDACRAGEYVSRARDQHMAELEASGRLPSDVRALSGLRDGLTAQHRVLRGVRSLGRQPAPMPDADRLARMGAEALRGGPDSAAMARLRRLETDVSARFGHDSRNATLVREYISAIDQIMTHRAALAGVPGMEAITGNGLVTGATQWRNGRTFMSRVEGPLENAITEELRRRMPASTETSTADGGGANL